MYQPYDSEGRDHRSQAMSNNTRSLGKDAIFVPEVRSPTVRRRELGALLRKLRTDQGLTVEQAAQQLMISMSKLSRMETGHGVASRRDVRDLCALYGVTDESERDRMLKLAMEAKQAGWWQSYDLPYSTYVGLEAEAAAISDFQSSVVPGLLQTAEYARAGHEGAMPRLSPREIERRIEAKLTRQALLTQDDPPVFSVVLDEAVLHRMIGGPAIMSAQLERLIEVAHLSNVTIQVIPFALGAHPGVESNFNILDMLSPTPGVVFVEGLVGSIYLERPEELTRYRQIFERLQTIALSPKDTISLITQIRSQSIQVKSHVG
jgi:transcriptional regulator with XRE-family HTH domain